MNAKFQNRLKAYAKLIVAKGINIQKGQTLDLRCPVECAEFGRLITEEAYKAGAAEVVITWNDDFVLRQKYLHASDEVMQNYPEWRKVMLDGFAAKQAAVISVSASDPEVLSGVAPDRIVAANRAAGEALKAYRVKSMQNYFTWCVVSVPTYAWAKKVFPTLEAEAAVEALWEAIFAACRVYKGGDPVLEWKNHVELMSARAAKLQSFNLKSLHYTNSIGTDLIVELPYNHKWVACGEKAKTGINFIANIPTEEIFTLPKKTGVNGRVVASKPLVLDGNLIENFSFLLKDGKIIEVTAEKGLEPLKNNIALDEGASYFGEVALVPYDSPISNSKILFYNTLFDENASCHFAFGRAYPTFVDEDTITDEEMTARGMNNSMTHIDFMVGTADLSITGETLDGKKVEIFKNGNFTF